MKQVDCVNIGYGNKVIRAKGYSVSATMLK